MFQKIKKEIESFRFQVVAHDESSDPHKFYQDSISRLERDSMMKNGSEEELMRQMQNEENIFLKYQHRFKAMMVNEEIPTSFPEYTSGTSEQSYMEKVNFWIDANPELIKPQYRN